MYSVSPVWTDKDVEVERVIALDQPQYNAIIALPIRYNNGISGMVVRFRLSDDERKSIADGADIVLTELTFGLSFTPISMAFCQPNQVPE